MNENRSKKIIDKKQTMYGVLADKEKHAKLEMKRAKTQTMPIEAGNIEAKINAASRATMDGSVHKIALCSPFRRRMQSECVAAWRNQYDKSINGKEILLLLVSFLIILFNLRKYACESGCDGWFYSTHSLESQPLTIDWILHCLIMLTCDAKRKTLASTLRKRHFSLIFDLNWLWKLYNVKENRHFASLLY